MRFGTRQQADQFYVYMYLMEFFIFYFTRLVRSLIILYFVKSTCMYYVMHVPRLCFQFILNVLRYANSNQFSKRAMPEGVMHLC